MKRNIMKRAHEIARTLIGDWYARLALALRQAWREAKEMVKLVGSEKQVAWAEEIRDGYKRTLAVLKDALTIVQDLTQKEEVSSVPWLGTTTKSLVYTSNTTSDHEAAITRAKFWAPKVENHSGVWIAIRAKELREVGENHPDRKALAESLKQTIQGLEVAIAAENNAKFWIDHK